MYTIIACLLVCGVLVVTLIAFFQEQAWKDPWDNGNIISVIVCIFIFALFCSVWLLMIFLYLIEESEEKENKKWKDAVSKAVIDTTQKSEN
jgi:uncharacterized membrane protein